MTDSRLPVVAVVGRPNVGKSTFFNRVLGQRKAIVDDTPGVTRDRHFARADWAGQDFFLVDTGGVVEGSDNLLDRAVRAQALAAVEEADLILFVVDAKEGIHPLDEGLAAVLRRSEQSVLLVANKVDNLPRETSHHEFWALGVGEPVPVSAISGKGSGDLLDLVVQSLPRQEADPAGSDSVRVAVIGKPNVGKSSFINRLFGEERMVVSEMAGTTRDAVDSTMRYHGRDLVFVDTAGLRRQSRIHDSIEYYAWLRATRVIRQADVCLVLTDASSGIHMQDVKVAEAAWEAGCGVIMVVNKWDLVDRNTSTAPGIQRDVRARTPFLRWVPFVFTSALTGQRVRRTLDLVLQVQAERERRIPTPELNRELGRLVARHRPAHSRGRAVKVRYGTQVGVAPPAFVLFSNLPREIQPAYVRYLENGFRSCWPMAGTPLRVRFKADGGSDRR